jgi:hypothetical protein
MRFRPGQRWVKNTDEPKLALRRTDHMRIVLIECVDRPGTDREYLPGREVLDLSFSADAIIRLEMVSVVKPQLGSSSDDRIAKRTSHRVTTDNQPATLPSGTGDIAFRSSNIFKRSNDHRFVSFTCHLDHRRFATPEQMRC